MEYSLGLPKPSLLKRYDGTNWRRFELNGGGNLIVTGSGSELLTYNPALRRQIRRYATDVAESAEGDDRARKWFNAGGNGDVYSVNGFNLVVKEASTAHSLWSSFDRMDYLYGVCKKFLPEYIRVPEHYGLIFSPGLRRQYSLMARVNDGLTVADLIAGEGKVQYGNKEWLRDMVIDEFPSVEGRVREAIDQSPNRDRMPSNLLPDWDAGNVIVDFGTTHSKMPFTFWIIDQ